MPHIFRFIFRLQYDLISKQLNADTFFSTRNKKVIPVCARKNHRSKKDKMLRNSDREELRKIKKNIIRIKK